MFRFNNWWSVIIPQILGWIYYSELGSDQSFLIADWHKVALFLGGVLAISSFGYVFNDYCDLDSDKISGKGNSLSGFSSLGRITLVIFPLIIGIICWALVRAGFIANTLYTLQILALIFYSAPPIRLKRRALLGVLADAFYGHINPAFFTICTFLHFDFATLNGYFPVLALIFICTSFKGVRNILLHQIQDRKRDAKAGIQTFVVKYKALFSLYLVNKLLPFEALFTIALALVISISYPPFILSIILFSVLTYFKFSGWKLSYLPKRQLKFKFLYFLNDYYEGWMPVFFLIILSVRQSGFIFLLILHLLLFPAFIIKTWKDLRAIGENFKTEEEY